MKLMLFDLMYSNKKMYKIMTKTTSNLDVVYVYLNKEIFNKNKFVFKLYKMLFKRFVVKKDKFIYVVSKRLEKIINLDILDDIDGLSMIKPSKNSITKNSIRYLEKENKSSSILIAVRSFIDRSVLEEYVKVFKEVNLYIDKSKINIFNSDVIKTLENEYGTSIGIITSDKEARSDIVVFLDDFSVNNNLIKSKKIYMLTENVLDKFSLEYEIYNKYKDEIIDSYNYLSRNLSAAFLYLHNLNKK